MKDSPGLSASLNEIITQDAIVNRLPPTLRHEWFRHQCDDLDIEGPVAFTEFAEWIELQAKILRRETINIAEPILPFSSASKDKVSNEGSVGKKWSASPSQDALSPSERS